MQKIVGDKQVSIRTTELKRVGMYTFYETLDSSFVGNVCLF
jgi:hypothetical protein